MNARKRAIISRTMKSAAKLNNRSLTGLLAGGKLSPHAYGISLSLLLGGVGEIARPKRYMMSVTIIAIAKAIANSMIGHQYLIEASI